MEQASLTLAALKAAITVLLVSLIVTTASCSSVLKTIELMFAMYERSEDGVDVIDCVDIYQQPALEKNNASHGKREIKTKPERSMKAMAAAASVSERQEWNQTWRERDACPAGTVPIRRASSGAKPEVAELARRALRFGRRNSSYDDDSVMDASRGGKLEVAVAYATSGPYLGARADIPLWKVNVDPKEYSMSYIMVGCTLDKNYNPMPGADPPKTLTNQIAVGLVSWPSLYGDSLPRLFVYHTNDAGVANNCFNHDCGGFHLKESPYALGATWPNTDYSYVGGHVNSVTVGIHRSPTDENWWVSVLDVEIGYFPETIFNTRFPEAAYVEMGGRVLNTRGGGLHTTTPMGNGMPACAGARFAATIMEYLGVDSYGTLFNDAAARTAATKASCYGVRPLGFNKARSGYDVAYGGPGGIYCEQPDFGINDLGTCK